MEAQFKSPRVRNVTLWTKIANEIDMTLVKYENKRKYFKSKYRAIKDIRGPNGSGQGWKYFEFEKEFDEIMQGNPSTQPASVVSSDCSDDLPDKCVSDDDTERNG